MLEDFDGRFEEIDTTSECEDETNNATNEVDYAATMPGKLILLLKTSAAQCVELGCIKTFKLWNL